MKLKQKFRAIYLKLLIKLYLVLTRYYNKLTRTDFLTIPEKDLLKLSFLINAKHNSYITFLVDDLFDKLSFPDNEYKQQLLLINEINKTNLLLQDTIYKENPDDLQMLAQQITSLTSQNLLFFRILMENYVFLPGPTRRLLKSILK